MVSIIPTPHLRFGGDCESSSSYRPHGSDGNGNGTGGSLPVAAAVAAAEDPINLSKTSHHHQQQHHPQKMRPLQQRQQQQQQESISLLPRSSFSQEQEVRGVYNIQQQREQQQPEQQHRPRHVSFNHVLETVHIQPLHELNEDDRSAMFLTHKDYARIRQELKDGVRVRMINHDQRRHRRQQKNQTVTDDSLYGEHFDFSMRGLETKSAQDRRRSNQRQARMAVFNEQALQKSQNESIPEVIAMLYNVLTLPSQQHALKLAIDDAASVIRQNGKTEHDVKKKKNFNTQTSKYDNQAPMLYGDEQTYTQDYEAWSSSSSSSDDGADSDDSLMLCEDVVIQLAKRHNPHISVEDWLLGRFTYGQLMADAAKQRNEQELVVCQEDHHRRHRQSSVDGSNIHNTTKRQRYDNGGGDNGEHNCIRPISPPIFPMGWSDSDVFLQQDEEMDFQYKANAS